MRGGEVVMLIFILILASLMFRFYRGATQIFRTAGGVLISTISTLQMPGAGYAK